MIWVRMDFPKVWEHEKYKEIHGKTWGNKWVFEKGKGLILVRRTRVLIWRLAGVQGCIFESVGRWSKLGESPHRWEALDSGHRGIQVPMVSSHSKAGGCVPTGHNRKRSLRPSVLNPDRTVGWYLGNGVDTQGCVCTGACVCACVCVWVKKVIT